MPSEPAPPGLTAFADEAGGKGQPAAAFALADVVRPESKEAVQRWHDMGVQVAMPTGDSEPVAKAVAAELGPLCLGFWPQPRSIRSDR